MTVEELNAQIESDTNMQNLAQEDPTEFSAQVSQLYHRFGYDKFGGPLSLAQKGFGKIARATGIPESSIQGAAAMVLPMAGTVAGATIGAPAGPVGAIGGIMTGSLVGGELNQALGITTERDNIDRALDLGAPLLGPLASKVGKAAKLLPGAGYALHEQAIETMETGLKTMRVTKQHLDKAFYNLAKVPDFHFVKPTKLLALLDEEIAGTSKQAAMKVPGTTTDVKTLTEMRDAVASKPTLKYSDIMALNKGFNKLKETNPSDTIWKRASGMIIDDLETASTNPKLSQNTRDKATEGLRAFRQMVQVNKAYQATDVLDNLAKSSVTPAVGDNTLYRFDYKKFKKGLENNDAIIESFSPAEITSMKDSIENLGFLMYTTASPTNIAQIGMAGGIGAGVSATAGQGSANMAIAGAGVSAAYMAVTNAVKSESGRKVIKYLATEGKGRINIGELQSILGKITAGTLSGGHAAMTAPSEGAINAFPNEP